MRSRSWKGWSGLRHLWLAAALVIAVLAAWPLVSTPGLLNTRAGGDSPFLLLRIYELQANLRAGALPARWMPDAVYGLGYPFFNYYAALPYYLGAALSLAGAGVLWGIKLAHLAGFLGAAAAMYALARALVDDEAAAFLAAAAYTFAPFHMVNVYVRGDSLSEFYAFVFYPLILWSIVRLRRSPSASNVALLALSYAGLMLTHNVSALIFSPLAGLALVVTAVAPRPRLRVLPLGIAGFVLGAALSAWFWLPALAEQGAASLTEMTTGYFDYAGHFRSSDLVQRTLLFNYAIEPGRTPFTMGGMQAGLAGVGLLALLVAGLWQRRRLALALALALAAAYAVWPITPGSAGLWARVPLLPMVQFPWRFYSIASLVTALLAGAGLSVLRCDRPSGASADERPYRSPKTCQVSRIIQSLLAVALGTLLAVSALALLRPESLPISEADVTPERLQLYEHLSGNVGSTVRAEYLPSEAVPRPFTGAALIAGDAHPAPVVAEGTLTESRLLAATPTSQTWAVTVSSAEARLIFQTYAFSGWQATVDGRPAAIDPTAANGRIVLALGAGAHEVALRLGPTPLRATAGQASLAAALIVLGLAALGLWRARAWRALAVGAGVVVFAFAAAALIGVTATRATPPSGPLATETMDFDRMPYLHANPRGVAFGDAVRLVGYELTPREAAAGDVLHLRLHWQVAPGQSLVATVRLTTAAEPLFRAPELVQSDAEITAVTEHTFTVPTEVAPGLALLAVEVSGPEGRLAPHTDQGAGLGTTYLAPVRVRAPDPSVEPAIDRLGQSSLELLQATVTQPSPDMLLVRVTWRPGTPLGQDYAATVRLVDAEGNGVPDAEFDIQPRYGMYPTSLWPVGVPVADLYQLPVPPGTPPGSGYQVEVGLYEPKTLTGLGSLRIPGVVLTQPTVDGNAPVLQEMGGLALSSWRVEREEISDGEEVTARVQWKAVAADLPDATWRLLLLDGEGREVAAGEGAVAPSFPPSGWPPNALVNGRVRLHVAPGTPPGSYLLALELRAPSGRVLGRWAAPNEIRVRPSQRQTTLPAFAHPVGATFGGLIALPGYDLVQGDGEIAVTLHWQALQAPGASYKVFLHLFDPAAQKNVTQRDAFPLYNTYFTSQWAAGEVVSDRLVLDMAQVPHGHYQLLVGWYDPTSGQRLEPAGDVARISDGRVLLQEIDW